MFQKNENQLMVQMSGQQLQIETWGEDSIRVRAVPIGEIIDTDYALLLPQKVEAKIEIIDTEEEKKAVFSNGKIQVLVEIDLWHRRPILTFFDDKGKQLLKDIGPCGALDLHAREFKAITGGEYQLTQTFEANKEEKLFGMGQYQQEVFDLNYCSFELAHRNSQASIPFVLSSLGYGFLWHNPSIGRSDFSKNKIQWVARATRQLDYWITCGSTPKDIINLYTQVTGRVPMMPEYGLGFWQSKLRYSTKEELLTVAREYQKRDIPVDVLVCDFFHWPKMGDFRFDEIFFPNMKEAVEELKEMGITLMVSVWPQIDVTSENYQEMQENNLLVQTQRGVSICMEFGGYSTFFDATNPKAREYVWKKCKENYFDLGIPLFWLDEAEPEYKNYDFDHYRYYAGSSLSVGNLYPKECSRTFFEGQAKQGMTQIVNLVRCAWAGSQRYGALVWSGDIASDFSSLRMQLQAGLHMGICGIPWWTTDIGGFAGGHVKDERFHELLIRWFQFGTYCPVMRLHGDRLPHTQLVKSDGLLAVFTGAGNEVWSFSPRVEEILTTYIHIREELRQETRKLMKVAHEQGIPLMRTMFLEFPLDEHCWNCKEQYMYGDRYLVAPVLYEGHRKKQVYLPKGYEWVYLHTKERFLGGVNIEVEAPLEVIPIFEKGEEIGSEKSN